MGPCPGGPKGPLAPLGPWDLGPFLGSWVPSPGSQGVSIRMALASTEREYLGACKYGACKRVGGHARSVKNLRRGFWLSRRAGGPRGLGGDKG